MDDAVSDVKREESCVLLTVPWALIQPYNVSRVDS